LGYHHLRKLPCIEYSHWHVGHSWVYFFQKYQRCIVFSPATEPAGKIREVDSKTQILIFQGLTPSHGFPGMQENCLMKPQCFWFLVASPFHGLVLGYKFLAFKKLMLHPDFSTPRLGVHVNSYWIPFESPASNSQDCFLIVLYIRGWQ
jgi:hypothetical protein